MTNEISFQVQDQDRQYVQSTNELAASLHSVRDSIHKIAGAK